MDGGGFMGVREAAERLEVHENTVRNWVRDGRLQDVRLPGARSIRLLASDVDRLVAQRGEAATTLKQERRVADVELASAFDLMQWPAQRPRDAQERFPELVRRLLLETPAVSDLRMEVGDGVAQPGFDGTARVAPGSPFVPVGDLIVECGTAQQVKAKAEAEFDRVARQAFPGSTFVFATPRRWAGGAGWAHEKRGLGQFADVRVVDAIVLEAWLEQAPGAHRWVSEHLGMRPREASTLAHWWDRFSSSTDPTLPVDLFLAGRSSEVDALWTRLVQPNPDKVHSQRSLVPATITADVEGPEQSLHVVVETQFADDGYAFVHAALSSPRFRNLQLPTALRVTSPVAWDRVCERAGRSLLLPAFEGADIGRALAQGHAVITVVDGTHVRSGAAGIALPRVGREGARQAFIENGVDDFVRADRLAVAARRSIPAFVRQFSRDPRRSRPAWTLGEPATVLAPLCLVQEWTETASDIALLEGLTSAPWSQIEALLRRFSTGNDPVLRVSEGRWHFVAPEEAFLMLEQALTRTALDRWHALALEVLLAQDPDEDLGDVERLMAQLDRTRPSISRSMRRGVSQGLAVAAALNVTSERPEVGAMADRIVGSVLDQAFADESWRWLRVLAPSLPLLAEAAPERFLDAVHDDLARTSPLVAAMFHKRGDILSASSPHTHLLWALETLAWSPDYLVTACRLLGQLEPFSYDPKSGNTPLSSLSSILVGWVRHTSASAGEKLRALDAVLAVSDEVGWSLLLNLLPSHRATSFPPAHPAFRSWVPDRPRPPMVEWADFAHQLVGRAIDRSGTNPRRLGSLAKRLSTFAGTDRARVLDHLETTVSMHMQSSEDRLALWEDLHRLVGRHTRFSEADWVLPVDDLSRLIQITEALAPGDDPRRFARLFDWQVHLSEGERGDYEATRQRIDAERVRAASDIWRRPDRVEVLHDVATRAKHPELLGAALASAIQIDTFGSTSSIALSGKSSEGQGSVGDAPGMSVAAGHQSAETSQAPVGDLVDVLLPWLDSKEPGPIEVAKSWLRHVLHMHGDTILPKLLTRTDLKPSARRTLVTSVPARSELWRVLAEHPNDAHTYWTETLFEYVPLEDAYEAINQLIAHGRAWPAIAVCSYAIDQAERDTHGTTERDGEDTTHRVPTDLVLHVLTVAGTQHQPQDSDLTAMTGHYVSELLDYLVAGGVPEEQIAAMEFLYLRVLEDSREPAALSRVLSRDPTLFVNLVKSVYRAEGQERDDTELGRAEQSWWVLHEWAGYPGQRDDGTIDGDMFHEWITSARLALSDSGRADVGDELIGHVLANTPTDDDGIWPAKLVRELVESVGSRHLENGLVIGKLNLRGLTTRGVYDGGKQERVLEREYRDMSREAAGQWPRTARILREIAASYYRDALREDQEAERYADRR